VNPKIFSCLQVFANTPEVRGTQVEIKTIGFLYYKLLTLTHHCSFAFIITASVTIQFLLLFVNCNGGAYPGCRIAVAKLGLGLLHD
jgi:hypothetical protein